MAYMHIDNLYKAQEILAFKSCYALEKIHGTSAHVRWVDGKVEFFSGGVPYDHFANIFDESDLTARFLERFSPDEKVVVYGEAYGGKCQKMSQTYGKHLKFVAFDVKIDGRWLNVPHAEGIVIGLGLEFVDYVLISTETWAIDNQRDCPSEQAFRNGIEEPQLREGIVLRPPFEVTLNNGKRVIAKHKRAEFSERSSPKVPLDPTKREILEQAGAIAQEWVTPHRLEHVIDHLLAERAEKEVGLADIPALIRGMLEDVSREAEGEIVESKEARKAIGKQTVKVFKRRMEETLNDH